MIEWSDEQLEAAGIDRKLLESLIRRLEQCGKDMNRLGLHMYGASGSGTLVHRSRPTHPNDKADRGSAVALIYAGHWDGGDW